MVQQTWTTDEFGTSHEGRVGVLLADGTTPRPVTYPTASGGGGSSTSYWTAYTGDRFGLAPRAHALRPVCSCGWTGPEHRVDWPEPDEEGEDGKAEFGDQAYDAADACQDEWDEHIAEVERSTVPLPEAVTELLRRLGEEIETLGDSSPLAALRAAHQLEVTAKQAGYWPACAVRREVSRERAAAALGLDEDGVRRLLSHFDGADFYS
ncbi:hypothetical protein BX285_6433 [Streptomyces sp. 1114.5]|uniref:hypothetical protein n=1 Tax=unclassified Streptomyces TaxID=2593676 RepID=UPI000BDDB9B5|nr:MULTISPECIES: hypothetical protein [unclassified Streptomyces]RKT09346.1 hypothetical protein BX285_6433 [Streptomyces sp. 1114.5]SOB88639.1 hypothetical protein SAMN06272789_6928 [Streptomyces sp. 1331.2]